MKNDIVSRTGHLINLGRWKRIRYIGNQEEVEGGSSWSARSSHIVVEPLLPTRRLFKQKTCFEKAVVKGKMRCLPYKALKRLIRTGLLIMESRIFVILGIRKKSKVDRVGQQGVPTSWLSPTANEKIIQAEDLFWGCCCEGQGGRCLPYKNLMELIRTGHLIMESRIFVILGIRKKSKMDQVGQQGVPTSWLSTYCQGQGDDYSIRRPVSQIWWHILCFL